MYIETKNLPLFLSNALEGIGYHGKDVKVEFRETAQLNDAGSLGGRAAVTLVDGSGKTATVKGSWGGPNPWSSSPVDDDETEQAIPENGAAIQWSEGGGPVHATVVMHPTNSPMQLSEVSVTAVEAAVLGIYRGIISSYRAAEIARIVPDKAVADMLVGSLVARGYLKRSKNGATQITTKGKNSAGRVS